MNVGFLWHCAYPWDVRLEKMIDCVVAGADSACVICKGRPDLPRREQAGRITIRRVMPPLSRPGLLNKIAGTPLFFNPLWILETRKAIREEQVDVLIVRDIPLGLLAARVARTFGKPVVLDMAENYPAALVSYDKLLYKPWLVGNAWLPRKYERVCLDAVNHVFVVAEEQRLRLLRMGIAPQKITLVGNTPVKSFLRSAGDPCEATKGASYPINLLYVGFIDPHRGLDTVLRAVPELLKHFVDLTVTVVGDGTAREGLLALAERLGIKRAVSFPGWVDFKTLPDYIQKSSICLIPHLESEHTNTTLPNKLFDYMAFAKPVVAANCKPVRRIIEESDCGVTFKSGNVTDFVNATTRMLRDPLRNEKGRNGRLAVERKYNWEMDKKEFMHAIQTIGSAHRDRSKEPAHPAHYHGRYRNIYDQ